MVERGGLPFSLSTQVEGILSVPRSYLEQHPPSDDPDALPPSQWPLYRFATQIILKGLSTETNSISIIPGLGAADEHKTRLQVCSKRGLPAPDATPP